MRILERVDFNKYANSFKMEYEKFARTFKNWDSYEYQAMDQDAYDEIWKKVFGSFVDDSYYDEWMEFFEPIIQEVEMKVFGRVAESSDKNVVEIQEEVRIPQKDIDIILEKGDKIKILRKFSLFEKLEVAHLRGGVPMYHGTSDKQLKNILKHGLLPQSQVYNSKYMQYAGDSENPDYVSVTTSRNHAMMFANNTVREIGGNPIVLVLRYQYPVYHDPEAGGVLPLYLYHGKIERDDIRAYYDENENKTKV